MAEEHVVEKSVEEEDIEEIEEKQQENKPNIEEIKSLTIPVSKLTKEQKDMILKMNEHPFYEKYADKKGVEKLRKRRKSTQEVIKETHPNSKLSDVQMIQTLYIDLAKKYEKLHEKHKKLKKRVNIIDEDTITLEQLENAYRQEIESKTVEKPVENVEIPIETVEIPVFRKTQQKRGRSVMSLFN